MSVHKNDGHCQKCSDIMNQYGVESSLRGWFTIMQAKNPEVHCSCAGRGEIEQESAYDAGRSKAHFGESPHNYTPSLALDLFRIDADGHASWDTKWYKEELVSEMPTNIEWGGNFKRFPDGPHFQRVQWNKMPRTKIWTKG